MAHIAVTFIGYLIIILFKGPGNKESVVGLKRCDDGWWGLFAALFIFGFLMTAVAIFMQRQEYLTKKAINWTFSPDDYHYEGVMSAIPFAIFGFISTFLAILCGFSPAYFYVPFLIAKELFPDNVIQTNALISLYATTTSTVLNFVFGRMPPDYFLMVIIFGAIGTLLGIAVQRVVRGKTGRIMYSMFAFNFKIISCLIVIPIM